MKSPQIIILLLALLCGTVAGFSSGILVNMNQHRVKNHYQIQKMKTKYFKDAKSSKQGKVYNRSFAVQFLTAFAKMARIQLKTERMISSWLIICYTYLCINYKENKNSYKTISSNICCLKHVTGTLPTTGTLKRIIMYIFLYIRCYVSWVIPQFIWLSSIGEQKTTILTVPKLQTHKKMISAFQNRYIRCTVK